MRKILLLAFWLVLCVSLYAENINQQRALRRAIAAFCGQSPVKLVKSGGGDKPAYYVYHADRQEKGFVIVSGEESDDVIAYSEHGDFAPDDIPEHIAAWLKSYEEQVEALRSRKAAVYHTAAVYDEIQPLIKTRWNQIAPYNNMVPSFSYQGVTYQCATGCVATAMAQILKYWSAPLQTKTIPGYTSWSLSEEMPELPATSFNYDIMKDSYSTNAHDASADEVARLMLYCGQGAKMDYYQNSLAVVTRGLFSEYFGFNPNSVLENRDNYNCAEWDELIYGELCAGRPVMYSGAKFTNAGHTFVVDGYRDGLFHVNWGWGGLYDGYYKLSLAKPDGNSGAGAGAGSDGYTFRQEALTRIQPEFMEPKTTNMAMTVSKLTVQQTTYTREKENTNFSIPVTYSVYNRTGNTLNCSVGLGLYHNDVLVKAFLYSSYNFSNDSGLMDTKQTVSFGNGISSGTYTLKAVWCPAGTDSWQEDKNSDRYQISLQVNGNNLAVTPSVDKLLQVNNVTFEDAIKVTKETVALVSVTNLGTQYRGTVYLHIDGNLQTGSAVYIDQNDTQEIPLYFTPTATGTHEVTITDGSGQLWAGTVTVFNRRDPILDMVGTPIVDNTQGTSLIGTTMKMAVTLKNSDAVTFDDDIIFRLFVVDKIEGGKYSGLMQDSKTVATMIPPGETRTVEVSFDNLTVGDMYYIRTLVCKASSNTLIQYSQTSGVFTVTEDPSGIATVSIQDGQSSAMYDLQGRRLSSGKRKGLYIVNGRKVVLK